MYNHVKDEMIKKLEAMSQHDPFIHHALEIKMVNGLDWETTLSILSVSLAERAQSLEEHITNLHKITVYPIVIPGTSPSNPD